MSTLTATCQIKPKTAIAFFWILSIVLIFLSVQPTIEPEEKHVVTKDTNANNDVVFSEKNIKEQDRNLPITFIGGIPRSGANLMRSILDAHPDIRCGHETHVIPSLLAEKKFEWVGSVKRRERLEKAGVLSSALDEAIAQFILEVILHQDKRAKYYCDQDPLNLIHTSYLHTLFPRGKFILMLRDGRATTHSILTHMGDYPGIDKARFNYRDMLVSWNEQMVDMYKQCLDVGEKVCLSVPYEQLVLQPLYNIRRIFDFLEIPWSEDVMNYDRRTNETFPQFTEVSPDGFQIPWYMKPLTKWFGHIPPDVDRDIPRIAPMLKILGYDPYDPTPKYGEPDDFVLSKASAKRL